MNRLILAKLRSFLSPPQVSFFSSLWNHPFFTISCITLIGLFFAGIHKRVVAPSMYPYSINVANQHSVWSPELKLIFSLTHKLSYARLLEQSESCDPASTDRVEICKPVKLTAALTLNLSCFIAQRSI